VANGGRKVAPKSSGQANTYNFDNVGYGKYGNVSLGGYYILITSFQVMKKIVYRGGLKYEKTGLVVDGESINDVGFTLGIGLPITGTL
jgi:hypothetical protein